MDKQEKSAKSCGSTPMPCYAKYSVAADGMILKDGHTMFNQDVAKDLNRKSYFEKEYVKLRLRENVCPTLLESESRALLKALQEVAECVGLDPSNSPSDTVKAVKSLRGNKNNCLLYVDPNKSCQALKDRYAELEA